MPHNALAFAAARWQFRWPMTASAPAPRTIGWLGVAAMVAVVLGVPAFLDQGVPLRREFNERPLRTLQKARPQGVLIGDSMLESRIDERKLNSLADERWTVLAQPGGSSAIWFLMMKNIIAALSPPPRTVIIFFRDRQLTLPAHRTDTGYRKTIETYMRPDEPEVEALLRAGTQDRQTGLERLAQTIYPVQWRRDAWQEKVQSWALDFIASSGEYGDIRDDAQAIFGLKNLRQDSGMDFEEEDEGPKGLDAEDHEFANEVTGSFLPAIIEIARQKNMQLIFFRVKRQPLLPEARAKESPTNPAYQQALRAYVEKAGATLVDETRDPEVTLQYYGSDDHVAPAQMKAYTELFWRKMRPHIAPEKTANPER